MIRRASLSFLCVLVVFISKAQVQKESHYLLGMDIEGFKTAIPFSLEKTKAYWDDYADFGRAEKTQQHLVYENIFKAEIYNEDLLIYVQIQGNTDNSSFWMGIDPQRVDKEIYKKLQKEVDKYVYDFSVDIRKDAVQMKINEAEQAATYVSKEFEKLKRDERRTSNRQESTNEKINRYEETLRKLREDSSSYANHLNTLSIKLDSMQSELENIKKIVELYKEELKSVK